MDGSPGYSSDVAFTETIKAIQTRKGSRGAYERVERNGSWEQLITAELKAEIESLKARQKAVEDLQIDRNVPVHLLNELVRQTPEGVYLTSVRQTGQVLNILGVAQTNERVSELLRNTAYNSEWLVKPELIEIKVSGVQAADRSQKRLFDFSLRVSVKRPQEQPGAVPVAPAAKKG